METTSMPPVAGADLIAPPPPINPESKPFWEATAEGVLLLKRCGACGTTFWYPRSICPACASLDTEWVPAGGRGVIYSFAVNRKGVRWYADAEAAPYIIAYVELDEGVRILTNIVGCDPASLAIGQPVKLVFHDTGAGSALFRFTPADPDEGPTS